MVVYTIVAAVGLHRSKDTLRMRLDLCHGSIRLVLCDFSLVGIKDFSRFLSFSNTPSISEFDCGGYKFFYHAQQYSEHRPIAIDYTTCSISRLQ